MTQLIIMRHSKAVDRLEAEDDYERGLTERGREDARRAGAAMAGAGLQATHALVSPSRRTRETFNQVRNELGDPPVTDPMALYHASMEMLERATLELMEANAQSIVIVGHNPGVGGLAHKFAAQLEITSKLPAGWPTSSVGAFQISAHEGELRALDVDFLFDPRA